jgi:hypothetical protein
LLGPRSKRLGVSKASLSRGRGAKSRNQEVEVSGLDEAALMSVKIRHATLSAMTEKLKQLTEDKPVGLDVADEVLKFLSSDTLRLFKDSEDRAHGTPKATVSGTGENGEHLLTYVIRDMTKDA